jgi:hypothetical protein
MCAGGGIYLINNIQVNINNTDISNNTIQMFDPINVANVYNDAFVGGGIALYNPNLSNVSITNTNINDNLILIENAFTVTFSPYYSLLSGGSVYILNYNQLNNISDRFL